MRKLLWGFMWLLWLFGEAVQVKQWERKVQELRLSLILELDECIIMLLELAVTPTS